MTPDDGLHTYAPDTLRLGVSSDRLRAFAERLDAAGDVDLAAAARRAADAVDAERGAARPSA